jgi:hypothetical protein
MESYELCRCGAMAERNEYGELVCEDCARVTPRRLQRLRNLVQNLRRNAVSAFEPDPEPDMI